MIDAARIRQEEGDGRVEPAAARENVGRARPRARGVGGVDRSRPLSGMGSRARRRAARLDLCEGRSAENRRRARIDALLDGAPDLRRRVRRLARSARAGRLTRLRRQAEGHDLDVDALVEEAVRAATGEMPDGRVYRASAPRLRDLATVVLIDVSESTREASVLEMERLAVSLLGDALDATHDPVALLAFASDGRERVGLTRVKDFDEPFGAAARSRLAGLEVRPLHPTRRSAAPRRLRAGKAPRFPPPCPRDDRRRAIGHRRDRSAGSCRGRRPCGGAAQRQGYRCLGRRDGRAAHRARSISDGPDM